MKRKVLILLLIVASIPLTFGHASSMGIYVESKYLAQQTSVVYVTPYGEKFHKSTCRYIKNSTPKAMSRDEAVRRGYGACKVCKP